MNILFTIAEAKTLSYLKQYNGIKKRQPRQIQMSIHADKQAIDYNPVCTSRRLSALANIEVCTYRSLYSMLKTINYDKTKFILCVFNTSRKFIIASFASHLSLFASLCSLAWCWYIKHFFVVHNYQHQANLIF